MEANSAYSENQDRKRKHLAANSRILVVDDDKWILKYSTEILEQKKYNVDTALGGRKGVELIKSRTYDLVLTDMQMNDYNGIDILGIAIAQSYKPVVIIMTGFGSIEVAIKAIKLGAFDYIQKPIDTEQTMHTITRALKQAELKKRKTTVYKEIISKSSKMKEVLNLMDLVLENDVPVLIEGESGTGKELAARYIHYKGSRADGPFIAVNCSALPEPLLESELFGHVKGAFTGAEKNKKGLLEEADGGTFLLDEIGDMPKNLQVKLLRFLQEGEIRRVGATVSKKIDVRIISSTNSKLLSLIKAGEFREDLYYRLKVVPITLPPLRERKEDIGLLLDHFLEESSKKLSKKPKCFSEQALTVLKNYPWYGNIRELENMVEGSFVLSRSSVITTSDIEMILHIPATTDRNKRSFSANLKLDLNLDSNINMKNKFNIAEKNYILKALEGNKWNQAKTAKELGIGRTTLWRRIKAMGLKKA